ncbi:MAG: VOC family protein [Pseudoxanthomonas sp.]
MNILGLESLVFGVEDLAATRQYLLDYGLDEAEFDPARGGYWTALDGTGIRVLRPDDPALPPNRLAPPQLRETLYAVADAATLDALHRHLGGEREVRVDADGSLHCFDDGGTAIGFQLTRRRPIQARHLGFNVPGQAPGRALNDCAADPDAVIKPRTLSHVVYFTPDVARSEAFYRRLGFTVTDRFEGLGPFMRPAGTDDHHTLFLIQSQNEHMVGCNHFTFHLGSASEVLQQGWNFARKGYRSFWGPGRHILGSNFFWYFNSPFGAVMEIDADMDLHGGDWQPRSLPANADTSQIFLFDARDKWHPGG